jgi:hypothetical protein
MLSQRNWRAWPNCWREPWRSRTSLESDVAELTGDRLQYVLVTGTGGGDGARCQHPVRPPTA